VIVVDALYPDTNYSLVPVEFGPYARYQLFTSGQSEFGPYAPRYQPRFGKRRVSTQVNQELKSSPILKPDGGKEVRKSTKKRLAVPKYRSILAIRDFPPILGRFNPYLSDERK
jgi:hypothetical protein